MNINQSPCTYTRAPCPLHCVQGVGFFFFFGTQGGHVRGTEADAFVCFISLELGFFWSYREEEWVLSCCKDSHRRNRQVGSGNRRHSPQSLVESESKDETDSPTLGAHFHRTLIHTAVEQIHLSTTLHEFEMVVEWTGEGCWGKDSPAGSMQRGNWSSFWRKTCCCCGVPMVNFGNQASLKDVTAQSLWSDQLVFKMRNDSSC